MNINDFVKKHQLDRKGVISIAKKLGIKGVVYLKDDQNRILAEIKKYEAQIDTASNKKEFMDLEKRTKELEERADEIASHEKELKKFHKQIKKEKNDLVKEKNEFESKKESKRHELETELLGIKLNHSNSLESLKIKTLNHLNDDFLTSNKVEYDKIKSKLGKITQDELKLIEW